MTAGNQAMYEKSLHVNINLWIGLTMLLFGGVMLLLAFRKKKPK
jgi:LPXTG-motif cell wall-anchored protein